MKWIGFLILVFLFSCSEKGVEEAYVPDKPIDFPHSIHSEIDCSYCHNKKTKSNKGESNVCLDCHSVPD